jgi:hypothetical protein
MLILQIVLSAILFFSQGENTNWTMRVTEDGVSVYTRFVEGSSIEECKTVVRLQNTTLADVLEIILDVKNYPSLFPDCSHAEILLQKGKYYDIHYYEINAPWPVKDRDAIFESSTTISEDGKRALVSQKSIGDYREEKKSFVRIKKGYATWEIEETEPGKVLVTYQFLTDPGGGIPAWLINSAIVSNPLKTMHNLQDRIKKSGH